MKRYNIQHGEYCIVYLKDDEKIHLKHPHHIRKIFNYIYMVMDITRLTLVIIYQYISIMLYTAKNIMLYQLYQLKIFIKQVWNM